MKNKSSIVLALLLASSVALLTGCGIGNAARINTLAPPIKAAWDDGVAADAELGVKARENATTAAALGVEPWSPAVAAIRREKHKQVGDGINALQPKAEATPR